MHSGAETYMSVTFRVACFPGLCTTCMLCTHAHLAPPLATVMTHDGSPCAIAPASPRSRRVGTCQPGNAWQRHGAANQVSGRCTSQTNGAACDVTQCMQLAVAARRVAAPAHCSREAARCCRSRLSERDGVSCVDQLTRAANTMWQEYRRALSRSTIIRICALQSSLTMLMPPRYVGSTGTVCALLGCACAAEAPRQERCRTRSRRLNIRSCELHSSDAPH